MKLKMLVSLLLCIILAAPVSAYAYIGEDSFADNAVPSGAAESSVSLAFEAKSGEDVCADVFVKNSDSVEGIVCSIKAAYASLQYIECVYYYGTGYTNNYNYGEMMFSCFMKDGGFNMKSDTKIATIKFKARSNITEKSANIFSYTVKEFYNSSMKELDHSNVYMRISKSSEQITVHNHTIVIDPKVEPTCTHTGLTEGKHCSVCKEIITPQTVIPMKSHEYQNGKCIHCGAADPDYKPYTGKKIYGDSDSDGKITSADSLLILRKSVKLENFSAEITKLSDVDGDGEITSLDSLEVLRCSVKLPTTTKAGKTFS